jgi:leucyl/phenylalanyl-tRNA---protein transferase
VRPAPLLRGAPPWFPPADGADGEGLVAFGGDLSPARLLLAYDRGIFPWYTEGLPPLWWSPDPRAVLRPAALHVSRRLARRLRQGRFEVTWDVAFGEVVRACGERAEGTWILPEMGRAYVGLAALGHAHSVEVWQAGRLVGGVYGVHRGGLFAAESMFHRVTDASKVALAVAVPALHAAGVSLVDVQFLTPHLASLGAEEWPRARYLAELARLSRQSVDLSAPPGLARVGPPR